MAWATSGRARTSCALLWSALLFLVPAHVTHADTGSGILALGYGPLEYELPEPGSYDLPPLGAASAAQRSVSSVALSALSRSGRLSVSVATPAVTLVRTVPAIFNSP